jgi:TonB-linked SusC/RagA family outer membrane protein
MKKFLLLCFAFALVASVYAQERTVSGRVTSEEDGSALPGVNVILKGTSVGTTTDSEGRYTLSVPSSGGSLVFSFIGLQTTEVAIGERTTLDVTLASDVTQLSEVVVTALGVTRETKSLPYASQQIKAENLNITQSVDVKGALAGKVAGVQVLGQAGSKLGEFGGIRIRGAASLTQDKEPLYILDGVPTPNPNDIDMNNIESVNVLKGPNATAMYGQRADAGVVLLTSKKGARGAGLTVEWQNSTTIEKVAQLPKMQNLYGGGYDGEDSFDIFDFGSLGTHALPEWSVFNGKRYIVWDNNYADESWGPKFDGQDYVPWYAWWPGTAENPNPYFGQTAKYVAQPNNIKDFYQTGVSAKNTISVHGGGNNYNLSLAYTNFKQKGITPYTDYTKHYLMANTEFDPSEKLKIISNIRYSTSEINGDFDDDYGNQTTGSFNSWFSRGVDTKIMKELKDLTTPDGHSASWNWWGPDYYAAVGGGFKKPAFWFNPYTFMERYKRIQKNENLAGSLSASYSITKEISVNLMASRNITEYKRDYFVPFFLSNSSAPELYNSWSNSFGRYRRTETENNYTGDIRYKKVISNFDVNALVGGNLRHNTYQRFVADMPVGAKTGGLIIPDVFTYSNAGIPPVPTTHEWQKKVNSIYANASVGWKGMVYVDVGVRRDWDSALPATKNGYTYSSIGGNFIFSEVLDGADFLSFGKVRASWAQVGSDVDPLLLEPVYTTGNQAFQGDKIMMYTPNTLVDPNLTTPLSTSVEGGFDTRFLRNRLGLSFTYYSEVRKDDILPIQIPSTTGYSSYVTNAGQTTRRGVEISIDGDVIKSSSGLKWNVLFNFGTYNTVVDELPAGQQSMTAPGGAGAFGFVAMTHELGNKWGQLRGTAIKRDADGNPVLNANGTYAVEFNQYLGSVIPDFSGGLVNTLNYKGVSLIVSIDYQKGGNFFSLTEQWGGYSGLTEETAAVNDNGFNVRDDVAEGGGVRVIGVNANGDAVDMYIPALRYFGQFYGNRLAEPYVRDASFIKLRDIIISYDLKQKLGNLKFIKGATVGLVGRNLALIAVSKENIHRWDPSILSQRYGENGQLPGTRSYGVNLTLRF